MKIKREDGSTSEVYRRHDHLDLVANSVHEQAVMYVSPTVPSTTDNDA